MKDYRENNITVVFFRCRLSIGIFIYVNHAESSKYMCQSHFTFVKLETGSFFDFSKFFPFSEFQRLCWAGAWWSSRRPRVWWKPFHRSGSFQPGPSSFSTRGIAISLQPIDKTKTPTISTILQHTHTISK